MRQRDSTRTGDIRHQSRSRRQLPENWLKDFTSSSPQEEAVFSKFNGRNCWEGGRRYFEFHRSRTTEKFYANLGFLDLPKFLVNFPELWNLEMYFIGSRSVVSQHRKTFGTWKLAYTAVLSSLGADELESKKCGFSTWENLWNIKTSVCRSFIIP